MTTRPRVAIIGMGYSGFQPVTPHASFREMMFEAALKAYSMAGLEDPRSQVDAFISCQEDYWEGISIADEFSPEPIGGVLRPIFTVSGDGLQGIAQAVMLLKTGYFDVITVESHAKPSDIVDLGKIYEITLDPVYVRPTAPKKAIPHYIAALDAVAYMESREAGEEDFAEVAAKNRNNGLSNPLASYASNVTVEEILESEHVAYPLTMYDISQPVDAALVTVLATDMAVDRLGAWDRAVWIDGVGYNTETYIPERHVYGTMPSIRRSALIAYSEAGITNPLSQLNFAEVDDRYSFMELLSLEEALLGEDSLKLLRRGDTYPDGKFPVNASGGSLATGAPFEATGLMRLYFTYMRLLSMQEGKSLVVSWRGPPTYTAATAVLSYYGGGEG
ncbi:MAG: thiolase domain-containing protein [Desulfurococcales archaeon]|nr:thiolase domain-containing protein [Desulfurococcales archaeon]